MSPAFDDPIFTDPEAAREALESIRWPNGPVCVHCGATDHVVRVEGEKSLTAQDYCTAMTARVSSR